MTMYGILKWKKIKIIFDILLIQFISKCIAGEDSHKHFPPEHYDRMESGVHGGPQLINITVYIEHITYIDVVSMDYSVHGYLIQEWYDERLVDSVSHETVITDRNLIWLPDTYCLSCRTSTLNTQSNQNVLIRISPNGKVFFSQLGQLKAACYMNLIDFPFDRQVCPFNVSSYAFSTEFIDLHWKSKPVIEQMQLAQFLISDKVTSYTENQEYAAGNFTVLSFEVYFTRQVGFYVLQVFTPCCVLVVLSWMIVYMEPADIGDRLAIGVTLILSMIFLLGYINQSLPKMSYIKAVDWYVIVSLAMIVSCVLESVFVYWLLHRKKDKENKELSDILSQSFRESNGNESPFHAMLTPLLLKRQYSNTNRKCQIKSPSKKTEIYVEEKMNRFSPRRITRKFKRHNKRGLRRKDVEKAEEIDDTEKEIFIQKVDVIAKISFPLAYLIFNITFVILYVKIGI